ncbi:Gfo/Idh/MocA family protein [Acidicapsa ligni]|uniref:Gfo/Idh/MocA family protein n=1 Tax=Acidicapsa ligni TaxID=542300 RepID=UPI0021E0D013|nr:Gfo/Idh/MocA family oxidoreductase [Acidicapsa ligni]
MTLSRRDFTRLGALGLAAQLAPQLAPQLQAQTASPASDRKIGYAIIGIGRIADHFIRGIQGSPNSKVTALVSGHPEKAAQYAEKYGVPKSSIYNYENMDAIRDNKAVDAVYVALPNSMHAEYTIRCAKAGKNVLCEKPMAVTVPEAESMIAACKAANVKLMIAYRCHYEPTNLRAVKLIREGAIGEVQAIQSAFGFNCGPSEWRLSKALAGGGPLFDVGIYCLNATRYLTGEEPSSFSAYANKNPNDPRFKDVEETISWITKFPSGILASCITTYGAAMDGYFRVHGSKGWLEVNPAFIYEDLRLTAQYTGPDGKTVKLDEPNTEKDPMQFQREADHFSDCILHNHAPQSPGEEGLRDMQYIREIYRTAGIHMS